jgi:hypothetical protein
MGATTARRASNGSKSSSRTRTRTITRAVRAIVWNPKKALLAKGGTMVFVSGKGKQAEKYECYGPIQGHGLKFERGLSKALGIEQGELHRYLDGRVLYGASVHGLLLSTDRDRKASAQARA